MTFDGSPGYVSTPTASDVRINAFTLDYARMVIMNDCFQRAVIQENSIVLGIAITTGACRHAQSLQNLAPASATAMGRMLTATALVGLLQNREGGLSLQMVGNGELGQIFADVNEQGHLRGYVKNPSVELPDEFKPTETHSSPIGPLMGSGEVSMIRMGLDNNYVQSTTLFESGEIDQDIRDCIRQSDQIPTQMHCSVILDKHNVVEAAAGIIVQGMPDTNLEAFHEIGNILSGGGFLKLLELFPADWKEIVHAVAPTARVLNGNCDLKWQCRCSYETVRGAIKMLGPTDMDDMIQKNESPEVVCDFCKKVYTIDQGEVLKIYSETIVTNQN